MKLSDCSVAITGGTGALGTAVCEAYLRQGCQVAIPFIFDHEIEGFEKEIGDLKSRVTLIRASVTEEPEVDSFFQTVLDKFGKIDILVNIVGGFKGGIPVSELGVEDWDAMMNLNLKSAFLSCKAILPHMKERKSGKIVNVSARAGLSGIAGLSAYCVSKGGVRVLTESIAEEVKDIGINVNAIMPSIIDTPANRSAMPDEDHSLWVSPTDIAKVIQFLTSDDAAVINGASIPVYGRA
ncbi:MAG: SDR family NAD(P)-dependent oxidoreductase [Candidatus Poribacteria bacterium]|nr:SDR family NAD(P)-dependent oxidoreductase [Candidatus Poribacteria bacterium]